MSDNSEFLSAVSFLPENLRRVAVKLSDEQMASAEEIKIRLGQKMTFKLGGGEIKIEDDETIVSPADLSRLIENATRSSLHSYSEAIKHGFIAVKGGHRLGLCGTVALRDEQIIGMRNFSSVNLRIAKQQIGISEKLVKQITAGGAIQNTVIVSPPGNGKTTLLRDIIRIMSNSGKCVGVADERGEIAASYMGVPQFDVGDCTDVMDGCPKLIGMENLIRVMSPQVVAIDEITSDADAEAAINAANCGVVLIATAHAKNADEFRARNVYAGLVKEKIFKNIITVENNNGARKYIISKLESVQL